MTSADELRQAIQASNIPIAEIADRAKIPRPTLYSFVSKQTKQLRSNAQAAVEAALRPSGNHFKEDRARFDHPSAAEAKALGLDPDAIALAAVEKAIKRQRVDAWIEANHSAMKANADKVRETGLWSDGLRLF